jgi:hypothetical protein
MARTGENSSCIASHLSMVIDFGLEYLEDLDEDPHGMVKEGLVLKTESLKMARRKKSV